ncbi:GAF and ANTAR domain-containing protein [Streptomyces sp. NPDC058274]|uniref:GAF and ANTAR domain-containing protein n=1 Tax=Streptomyces sp. NPDC058274 TaxID=3346416 RepID=UPI0036E9D28E
MEPPPGRRTSLDVAALIRDAVRNLTPEEVPARLCALAVDLLPVSGASMSLRSDGLPVRLGASDATAARIADVQGTLGEGPGLDAASAGRPVLACDLTSGGDAVRWPVFAQQATEAGARAMYSLPLGDAAVCVGTLDLYCDVPAEPTGSDLRTAHLVAGVVTVALMSLPRGEWAAARGDDSWLSTLASDHDEIHQAIGMIMAQLGVCADDALARLRGYAFAHSRTAGSAAREVLAHRKRFHPE